MFELFTAIAFALFFMGIGYLIGLFHSRYLARALKESDRHFAARMDALFRERVRGVVDGEE